MKPGQPTNVPLKQTTAIVNADGNHLFQEGIILRKVSKFMIARDEDGIIPIPVFFDPQTGKILIELLPPELREEYAVLQGDLIPNDGAKTESTNKG